MASDTDASGLLGWYNRDVQRIYRQRRFFDKAGLFLGDGSCLFVPDNPNYEGSTVLLFDEHNHPVSREALERMAPAQAARVRWRRCYKLVSLLHTNEAGDFFLYTGIAVVPGNDHEAPVFWKAVEEFVARGRPIPPAAEAQAAFSSGSGWNHAVRRRSWPSAHSRASPLSESTV